MNDDLILAKLIKEYILLNPFCTANNMALFFTDNNFGLKGNYNAKEISYVIRKYNSEMGKAYKWFNIDVINDEGKANVYVVKE